MLNGLDLRDAKVDGLPAEIVDADDEHRSSIDLQLTRGRERTETSELFCCETRAGCPSRIRACCCGLDGRNETVSPPVTHPAEQRAQRQDS